MDIKNRYTNNTIYESKKKYLKDAVTEAVKMDANLSDADLSDADLRGVNLTGADLTGADLTGAYLIGADLRGADLRGANLTGADLRGAYLRGAYLTGAKNYVNSHDIFIELIRRQKIDLFTPAEWGIIGIIFTHRICWDSIKKGFKKAPLKIFKKLKDKGFGEWYDFYEQTLKVGK